MAEYKVGEQIILEVQEATCCDGCFFFIKDTCYNPTYNRGKDGFYCEPNNRSDGKNVIFVEKK